MVNIFGPILHHGGQLPILAVQVLLSCLYVFLTLLSLTSHQSSPASAPYTAPGAPLRRPWPRASLPEGLSWSKEQQEENGSEEMHDGRGVERKGGLLVIRSTLEDCCQMIGVTGHRRPVTAVCLKREKNRRRERRRGEFKKVLALSHKLTHNLADTWFAADILQTGYQWVKPHLDDLEVHFLIYMPWMLIRQKYKGKGPLT